MDNNYIETESLTPATIEQIEQRFITLINGPKASIRRTLLALLCKPMKDLRHELEHADISTLQDFIQILTQSSDYIDELNEYVDLLKNGKQKLSVCFDQLLNPT